VEPHLLSQKYSCKIETPSQAPEIIELMGHAVVFLLISVEFFNSRQLESAMERELLIAVLMEYVPVNYGGASSWEKFI